MNLEQAMKNPARTFGTPQAVLDSHELSREQKRSVLLQWKDQLELEQTADNENMQSEDAHDGSAQMLQLVSATLLRLDGQ